MEYVVKESEKGNNRLEVRRKHRKHGIHKIRNKEIKKGRRRE